MKGFVIFLFLVAFTFVAVQGKNPGKLFFFKTTTFFRQTRLFVAGVYRNTCVRGNLPRMNITRFADKALKLNLPKVADQQIFFAK